MKVIIILVQIVITGAMITVINIPKAFTYNPSLDSELSENE